MKKLVTGMIAASMLLAGSMAAYAANVSIKVAYENNPGEPFDEVMPVSYTHL